MRIWMVLALMPALAACAGLGGPIRMFPGEPKPDAEIVTLLPPPSEAGRLVLYVDRVKTSNCTWRCAFHRPVQVLPGRHSFQVSNYAMTSAPAAGTIPDQAGLATDISPQVQDENYAFAFDSALEAGKRYRLQIATGRKQSGQQMQYVWWQEESAK